MHALFKKVANTPQPRIFACLDEHGICRAFRQSAQPPGHTGWHEVNEQRLNWLGAQLPKSAFAIH
ncbi:hypothetical protein [Phytopseudomonas punonensis]|uniref:Uncharacterized protein n=1 Tax=Phytopseudomonas punonensis TaxID=1220495 RepID=A0A1M6X699_9GAMM|nr:hypothetical protein [Pseudomonas punonensis]SHL01443.1 hypothetical protein SAMN05216288_0838 [Pseudomonas punonensis]